MHWQVQCTSFCTRCKCCIGRCAVTLVLYQGYVLHHIQQVCCDMLHNRCLDFLCHLFSFFRHYIVLGPENSPYEGKQGESSVALQPTDQTTTCKWLVTVLVFCVLTSLGFMFQIIISVTDCSLMGLVFFNYHAAMVLLLFKSGSIWWIMSFYVWKPLMRLSRNLCWRKQQETESIPFGSTLSLCLN